MSLRLLITAIGVTNPQFVRITGRFLGVLIPRFEAKSDFRALRLWGMRNVTTAGDSLASGLSNF
jgi:hypothetical protein